MPQNTREIHKALLEAGLDVPEDANRFRNFMAEVVRKGIVKSPTRIPAPDGGRGKVGSYDDDTVDRLTRYLRSRSEAARVKSELIETARQLTPMKRRLSVSFWVPEDLADRIGALIASGYSLPELQGEGHRLSYRLLPNDVTGRIEQYAAEKDLPIGMLPRDLLRGKWGNIVALDLAADAYELLEKERIALGHPTSEKGSTWTFEFEVQGGRVVKARILDITTGQFEDATKTEESQRFNQ